MSELSYYLKLRGRLSGCDAKQFECDKYLDCDSCLEDKIKEHDNQIRAEAFDELKWLVIKSHCDEVHCHYCDDKPRSPKNTMCVLSDLEEHFDKSIEQLKENK